MGGASELWLDQVDGHAWGVLLEVALLALAFVALAVVCDEFLVPALETLCQRWRVREDVAGASFLALGSAAPEILVNSISTIRAGSRSDPNAVNLGVGAILGSSVIAFSLIPGCCALFSGELGASLALKRRPLMRDLVHYATLLGFLTHAIGDGRVELWEAATMLGLYAVYLLVVFSSPGLRSAWNARVLRQPLAEQASFVQRAAAAQGDAPAGALRVDTDGASASLLEPDEAGAGDLAASAGDLAASAEDLAASAGAGHNAASVAGSELSLLEGGGAIGALAHGVSLVARPLRAAIGATCPNCEPGSPHEYLYPLGALVAFAWVSLLSFVVSAVVTRWGELSGVPNSLLGFAIVSIGAEIPDTIQSVTVARRGYGSMAVSNGE